jgi:hypothetical protein
LRSTNQEINHLIEKAGLAPAFLLLRLAFAAPKGVGVALATGRIASLRNDRKGLDFWAFGPHPAAK